MIALFSMHFTHLSASFFLQSQNPVYILYFPTYLLIEACAYDLRFALPESTTAQASNAARVRSQKAPVFHLFVIRQFGKSTICFQ